jgi:RNA:NAD 2'-phosphotransferase (TPT1/KptA family)
MSKTGNRAFVSRFTEQGLTRIKPSHIHDFSQNRIKYMPFCIHNKIILSVSCESLFDASIINVS